MMSSRIRRYQDEQEKKKIFWAIGGSVALIAFLALFGIKILEGFSIMVDKIRDNSPTPTTTSALILPPVLDPLPTATNSAALALTGHGQSKLTVVVYVNDTEYRKVPIDADSSFSIAGLPLKDGTNTVYAKVTDGKNTSEPSNTLAITFKKKGPKLEITKPSDNSTVNGDDNTVEIDGTTDDGATVTVNGRFIVIKSDNSFAYKLSLNEGDNKLTIVATDEAGNTTTVDRTVTYKK